MAGQKMGPTIPSHLAVFHNLFRRFRACEIIYIKGYPLDGYALMRDVKDRAFLIAGVAHNITTLIRVLGLPVGQPFDPATYGKQTTDNRKNNERRVMRAMTGKESGLSADVQQDLKEWDENVSSGSAWRHTCPGARPSAAWKRQRIANRPLRA